MSTCDIVHLPWIHANLYLGSMDAANNPACTGNMNIVCVANGNTCNNCAGDACTGVIQANDVPMDRNTFDTFTRPASEALDTSLSKGPTLVHCYAGINRSSASIARYAIEKQHKSPAKTIEYLRHSNESMRGRPALTNPTFVYHIMNMN